MGVLGFNFFFLPPVGTFTIAEPENWAALFAFLVTAVTASKLSSNAKSRAEEALAGRNEMARLYELSRALLMDEGHDAVRHSVAQANQILRAGPIAFFEAASNRIYGSLSDTNLSHEDLARVAQGGEPLHRAESIVIPVGLGSQLIGSLAFAAGHLSADARESVASLLAINYERAHALNRAAAAEVARRGEEFKSSLLDGLAHDLKTPLTAIRSCATRLIAFPPRTDELRQELLNIIDQESIRLQTTITEAVELARVESSDLHLDRERRSVIEIVEAALAEGRDEDRARYAFHIPPDLQVFADPLLLRRALTQIFENARKYTPPGSPVQVEAAATDSTVTLSVLDRGPGLQPGELERVFDKFYRGRGGRDKVEGTGMGLAIARSIVEAHGGKVCAANRAGGGTSITMSLPTPFSALTGSDA